MIDALQLAHPVFKPGSLKAYLAAGLIIAAATTLRLIVTPWASNLPFVVFFPAVIVATFLCGSAAGFLAVVLSLLSAWAFVLPHELSSFPVTRSALFSVGAFTVVGISAALRAATAKVWQLNETLRISEEKFRGLLETAPDAMIVTDARSHISLINARTEALFGYARAELLGKPVDMLLPEHDREAYRTQRAALASDAAARVVDLQGLCKDGQIIPIEISLGLLDARGGLLVSNAIRDITMRRQIEASLAEASKAKSDFLARVSHELRTPLNAIIGFSELIRDAVIAPLDARYREYGGDINGAGKHLLNIVNDILDISKIEDGRLELRDETVSIAETIETCRRLVVAMAEGAGVALSISASAALPRIRCDQIRLRQILINVMSNAVKFTPSGGHVSVSAAIGADGPEIVVADTGIGMSPEQITVALQPFRQIESTLSRRFDGTGLGLPLAKALAELHGGHLDIQSEPAKGTIVRLRLPLARVIEAAA